MDLISIIVPIYNAEKVIKRCIESISRQSYEMLEIILVDDGSTDQSLEICEDMSEKDSRKFSRNVTLTVESLSVT